MDKITKDADYAEKLSIANALKSSLNKLSKNKEKNAELRDAAKNEEARIIMTIQLGDKCFKVQGYGHPDLTWEDPADMVARRSEYVCPRTLMIKADYASVDVPRDFVASLRDGLHQVDVTITVDL